MGRSLKKKAKACKNLFNSIPDIPRYGFFISLDD